MFQPTIRASRGPPLNRNVRPTGESTALLEVALTNKNGHRRAAHSSRGPACLLLVVPRFCDTHATPLSEYLALIQTGQGETAAAISMRTELEQHFGASSPLMLNAERLLRFQTFKAQREKKASAEGGANGNFRWFQEAGIRLTHQELLRWHEIESGVERGFCRGCDTTLFWQREEKILLVNEMSFVRSVEEGKADPGRAEDCEILSPRQGGGGSAV